MTKRYFKLLSLLFIFSCTQNLIGQVQLGATIEDPDSMARIGWALDFSEDGQRLIAGAPYASPFFWLGGKVRVFDLVDDAWVQVGQDLFGNREVAFYGTHLSMSADGSRFAVSVDGDDVNDISGELITYEFQNGQWDTLGQVLSVGAEDWAGASVQMSADGSRLVLFVENEEGDDEVIQAYQLNGDSWEPFGNPIGEDANFRFQGRIAMSADGQTLAVNGTSNSTFWRFKVYRLIDGQWQQLGSTIASSEESDLFAWSMSLSADGNRMAVGAPKANNNGADSGNVTIWDFSEGDWIQVGSNIPGENFRDETGFCVSLSDDGQRLVVGDRFYDDPEFNSGRIRIFQWVESDWQQIGLSSIGEDRADFFGQAVAISPDGSTVGGGAPQGGTDTPGQVKVFGEYPWDGVSGLDELSVQLRIFPNPTQDYLYINAPENTRWRVYDAQGKMQAVGRLVNEKLDLRPLRPGAYLIYFDLEGRPISHIVIKQ